MPSLDVIDRNIWVEIEYVDMSFVPFRLVELGCLPGNKACLLYKAPLKDPLYFIIDENHVAIRRDIAKKIQVKIID